MSKILILTSNPKTIPKSILDSEKYIVSDTIGEDAVDVILISKGARVSAKDIETIANNLYDKITCGCDGTVSLLTKFIYKLFGSTRCSTSCGIIGIPASLVPKLALSPGKRIVSIIVEAEKNNLPLGDVILDESASRWGKANIFIDLYYLFLQSQPLKFVFSSVIAFLIDYFLLIALDTTVLSKVSFNYMPSWFGGTEISIFIAWCVSSFTNFIINRYFVFKANTQFSKSLAEYYSLAAIVLILKNYVLLEFLIRAVHINLEIAKLIAEIVFFVTNYFIQKKLIFKNKPKSEDHIST